MTIKGHCLCGEIQYELQQDLRSLVYCHCDSCRRATGAIFVAWGTVDYADFHVVNGDLDIARTSEHVERGFCGNCGTSITYRHAFRAEEIDITLVTLDDPEAFRPAAHIWVQDKLPWVSIDDDLPQYETVVVPGD